MTDQLVALDSKGPVAWLRLNRPDAMNAVSDPVLDELDSWLEAVERDDSVRVLVITGTGRAFSAGGDLTTYERNLESCSKGERSVDGDQLLAGVRRSTETFDRIRMLGKPTIAAVNGYAVAGGMSIMMACDLVIAAESARIGDGHSNYGIVPGGAGIIWLARIVGPVIAKYLAFTGNAVAPSELLKFGLINKVVPDDELYDHVSALAEELANKSPRVLASMKRLIDDGIEQPIALAPGTARQALALHVYSCSDMQEGLAAFREKRQPTFE